MTSFRLFTSDGEELEARWDAPSDPDHAVVFCHPHPEQAGTMNAPLMRQVTEVLSQRGGAVLRFNFRGVGTSSGKWDGGEAEGGDVAAAVDAARAGYPELPVGLAGWSFGAAAALRWQARSGEGLPYVGIAPPAGAEGTPDLPAPEELPEGPRLIILGERDRLIATERLRPYAQAIGATLEILPGSGHFFYHRERKVGELATDFYRALLENRRPNSTPPTRP